MMTALNGQERTVQEFCDLGVATGWKLERVDPTKEAPERMSALVFSPVA